MMQGKYEPQTRADAILSAIQDTKTAGNRKGGFMGKGDRRSRRGKLFRGTFGKRRPRKKKKTGKR
jgi:30S ribosomal protein S31